MTTKPINNTLVLAVKPRHSLRIATCASACFLCLALATPASAQTSRDIVRGVLDVLTRSQGQQGFYGSGNSRPDLNGPRPEYMPDPPGPWATRDDLFAAAQAGELTGIYRAPESQRKQFRASIYHILMSEYQVPPITTDCRNAFDRDVSELFDNTTRGLVSVMDENGLSSPRGQQEVESAARAIREVRSGWQSYRTACDTRSAAGSIPHPYKAALIQLLGGYKEATTGWVKQEAKRRNDAYRLAEDRKQEALARERQARLQAQAEERAQAQAQFDAEVARVRAAEKARADKEKARVGG